MGQLPTNLRFMAKTLAKRRIEAPSTLRGSDSGMEGQPQPGQMVGPDGESFQLPQSAGGASMPAPGEAPAVSLATGVAGIPGVFALNAAEAVLLLSNNPRRQLLIVANLGSAIAYVQFDNPVAGVLGIPLVGGATMFADVKVPINAIAGYSPLGTSLYVYEG